MKQVLIIKTGLDETFASSAVSALSLGDVLRTTVLLHLFSKHQVTWITSKNALPLLRPNSSIKVVEENQLISGSFDQIINLEKAERWTEFTRTQSRDTKCFGFIHKDGSYLSGSSQIHPPLKISKSLNWQAGLFKILGHVWHGEEYVYDNPRVSALPVLYDVGLNWQCGPKWPSKSWSQEKWQDLHYQLSLRHQVSWQQGFDSIDDYAAWIQSCKTLVTVDSLGLHLALALKKPVVALFGPTSSEQIHLYHRGLALSPSATDFPCAPCFEPQCPREITCMSQLRVNNAVTAFEKLQWGGPIL